LNVADVVVAMMNQPG